MIAVYPGSFDPTTHGHVDMIQRASSFTDKLIVAVLNNPNKNALFTVEERVRHLKLITKGISNVDIESFSGLLVDFAKQKNAKLIIRGLRVFADFEYEFQMALTNKQLNCDLETLFIPSSIQNLFISSSVVKEIARFNGNFHPMVPQVIVEEIKNKFNQ